jgi:hypothetical protein
MSFSVVFCSFLFTVLWRSAGHNLEFHKIFKAAIAFYLLCVLLSVLAVEIVIATKGRHVVISGNCMLVELDPRFGIFGF